MYKIIRFKISILAPQQMRKKGLVSQLPDRVRKCQCGIKEDIV